MLTLAFELGNVDERKSYFHDMACRQCRVDHHPGVFDSTRNLFIGENARRKEMPMKSIVFLTILAIAFASPRASLARVGETQAQIQARYGKPNPLVDLSELGHDQVLYSFNAFTIIVTFVNGRSERERYSKSNEQQLLRDDDIELLLAANAPIGTTWNKESKNAWKRSDAKLVATYFFVGMLEIMTTTYDEALRADRTKKENDKLKGF